MTLNRAGRRRGEGPSTRGSRATDGITRFDETQPCALALPWLASTVDGADDGWSGPGFRRLASRPDRWTPKASRAPADWYIAGELDPLIRGHSRSRTPGDSRRPTSRCRGRPTSGPRCQGAPSDPSYLDRARDRGTPAAAASGRRGDDGRCGGLIERLEAADRALGRGRVWPKAPLDPRAGPSLSRGCGLGELEDVRRIVAR